MTISAVISNWFEHITNPMHNIVVISGLSTTSSEIGGNYSIGITTATLVLAGVGTTSGDTTKMWIPQIGYGTTV